MATKSTVTMASLSHDVVVDILCLLGVKDLVRFRCISKLFCRSIDDPDFIKLHLSHSLKTNNNRSLIFRTVRRNSNPSPNSRDCDLFSVNFDSPETVQKLSHPLDVYDEGKIIEILGSCNGLLALYDGKEISLWNPSTRKYQTFPVTEIEFPSRASCVESLVYGLGYDSVSDDYKLVRVVQFDSLDSEVKVYNVRTNSWRRIKDFPFHLKYKGVSGIFADNALHWVASKVPETDTQSFGFVVSLDLETEEYRVVELPGCVDSVYHMNVKAMGGCLCLIANYWPRPLVTNIWMMKKHGVKESWTKLISLTQSESVPAFKCVLPLAFSKNGDNVLLEFNEKKLMWYDITSKRIEEMRIGGLPCKFCVEMLVESLVPLNGNSAMINKEKQPSKKKQKKEG